MTRSGRLLLKSVALLAITMYGLAMPKSAHAAATFCSSVCVFECSSNACDFMTQGLCPHMEQCGFAEYPNCAGTAMYQAICT